MRNSSVLGIDCKIKTYSRTKVMVVMGRNKIPKRDRRKKRKKISDHPVGCSVAIII